MHNSYINKNYFVFSLSLNCGYRSLHQVSFCYLFLFTLKIPKSLFTKKYVHPKLKLKLTCNQMKSFEKYKQYHSSLKFWSCGFYFLISTFSSSNAFLLNVN